MSTPFSAAGAEIRTVVEQLRTAWTDYPLLVEYDNKDTINLAEQTDPFLCVSIINLAGGQLDLGAAPRTRQWGQIQLAVAVKKGQGVADLEELMDFLAPYFSMKDFATVRCQAFSVQKDRPEKEWLYRPAIIPFSYIWE